ncbi:MAG: 5'-methylthioadenosine/S-adenosylhomocysteine nucleosidase [Erysipelotrichaceae bacterium]|nr:5'-methylthioadenosine/S-adenosylhomocysteine nucleosidase [Erysipelotrichaceae bacterium]MBQ7888838.1 5'-methylthioadenosine/S-adenosylhomocysteine nucleosidase [Erysipelotrichaceae bacterium]
MKIGMIVAIVDEMKQLLNEYGSEMTEIKKNGYTVYKSNLKGHEVFAVRSGAGEIGAAAVAQLLITAFDVELIVNYGVVGGLIPEMGVTETVVVKDVVHYDYDTSDYDQVPVGRYMEFDDIHVPTTQKYVELALKSHPELRAVSCASGDKFVEPAEKKRELHEKFNCEICEMEAAGIVLTATRNGVDTLLIKSVSDSVDGGMEEFAQMVERSAKLCMEVLISVLESVEA